MAKQIGVIKIKGTFDGFNFYESNGKMLVRKAGGGFNSNQLKTSPNMERSRQNSSEFGVCSKLKKELRIALQPFYIYHKDPTIHGRLMKIINQIKLLDDVSKRGARTFNNGIQKEEGRRLFKRFEFSPKRVLTDVLHIVGNSNIDDLDFSVANFFLQPGRYFPKASHMEVVTGNLNFCPESSQFDLELGSATTIPTTATKKPFKVEIVPPKSSGLNMLFCCVRFYDKVGDELNVFRDLEYFALQILAIG